MQLEAAHAVEIIVQLMKNVDRKEDPLIQVVGTQQHNINPAVLQTARRLKIETHRETRAIKEHSRENERKMAKEEDARTNARKLR